MLVLLHWSRCQFYMNFEYHPICSSNINVITGQWFWIIYTAAEIMEFLLIILTKSLFPSKSWEFGAILHWVKSPLLLIIVTCAYIVWVWIMWISIYLQVLIEDSGIKRRFPLPKNDFVCLCHILFVKGKGGYYVFM